MAEVGLKGVRESLRWALLLAAAVTAALFAAASGAPAAGLGDGIGGVSLKQIGSFAEPVHVTRAPGRGNRKLLFVSEQEGIVRVLRGNKTLRRPFLDIRDEVLYGGERGLLSIAFDPDYGRNRRFYAYFTDAQGDIRVSQYRRRKSSRTRASAKARKVIEVPHREAANHNGGTVAFGPDGYMYLGTGDGGSGCDPDRNAQNPQSLLGKLLRIDPKRRLGYRIPAGNPFVGSAPRDEIYADGLRNPFRFSFDAATNTIAIGDVGQNDWEEVDYQTLENAKGADYGWNAFEGTRPVGSNCSGSAAPRPPDHTPPIHEYGHGGDGHTGCSITGGLVVRDPKLTTLYGRYLYADFCTSELRSLIPTEAGARGERALGLNVPNPTSFAAGRANRVYVTSNGGGLFRLTASDSGAAAASSPAPDFETASEAEGAKIGGGRGGFKAKRIANFSNPVYVHGPKGANGLIFVVEQRGVIRMIKDGRKLRGKFLDIRKRVLSGGERGLLSVAFAPSYAKNRRFYVFYTAGSGDLVVEEYRARRKDPRDAKEKSARRVISVRHRDAANHNGGQLQFGPDKKLYISTGDGGGGGDPADNAQNRSSLLGKILRITPRKRRGNPYTVPNDNPFKDGAGRKEVYSFGLRNPYRFSFDSNRRRIVIGDVGQDAREEVDYEKLGKAKGANFGWDAFEGKIRFNSQDASPAPKKHERPIHDYSHSGGNCSITGGYVVRDRRIPSLFGRYIYADFCAGQIRTLIPRVKGAKRDRSAKLGALSGISSFGEDSRGRIYFARLGGGVYKIRPN